MSVPERTSRHVDLFEHMFEYEEVSLSVVPAQGRVREGAEPRPDQVRTLQGRIRGMQPRRLDERSIPTRPELAPLLPGGALRTGSAYAISDSTALLMTLLAGPSSSGAWCAVIGVPDFGIEAATEYGIDLSRLVLIPSPGARWLTVTAAIVDVLTVIAVKAPTRVGPGDAARLNARLRQREATLLAVGGWPQAEAELRVTDSEWEGLGAGHGYLSERRLTVAVAPRGADDRVRTARLRLPGGSAAPSRSVARDGGHRDPTASHRAPGTSAIHWDGRHPLSPRTLEEPRVPEEATG